MAGEDENENTTGTRTGTGTGAVSSEICKIGIKPPVFSRRDPDLYFIQMESQFRNAGIKQDQTMYDYVVGSLDSTTLTNVADIVRSPPATDKYKAIKTRLIKDFTDSENKKLNRLIKECELGDQKPSQLLRQMRVLSGSSLTDDAIKTFWLDRLPESVRAVVSIAEGDLDRCAQQADKMMEIGNFNSVSSVQYSKSSSQPSEISALKQTIDALRREINEIRGNNSNNQRGRSQTPARDNKQRNRTRSQSQVNKFPNCFYHHRFGAEAKKCVQPCAFKKSEN